MLGSTKIGAHKLDGVIGNSPGLRKELAEWHRVGRSAAGAITVGSVLPGERAGNSGEVFWVGEEVSLNSLGLPARAPQVYSEDVESLRQYGKPIIVNLAGFKLEDFINLARMFADRGFLIELNLTCPNIERGTILAFDLELSRRIVVGVRQILGGETLIVKLNPHPDSEYIGRMSNLLAEEGVDAIALGNTVPNCMVLDPGTLRPVTTPNNGLAGMSGRAIKPIMLGQVWQYRQRLPKISIIAEGGIWSGKDILDYLVVGANFCRTATLYAQRGAAVFADLTREFLDEMEWHKFGDLSDIPIWSGD